MLHTAHLEHELSWYFDEAEGAIKQLRSTWIETIRKDVGRDAVAPGLRCGPIYVHSSQHAYRPTAEMNDAAMAAAARANRISAALREARWTPTAMFTPPPLWPADVLQLRFREKLDECRFPFGVMGFAARRARPLDVVRQVAVRGCGNMAHLTPAALEAWGRTRTTLSAPRWVDQLGRRLQQGKAADEGERTLGKLVAQQCAALELRALEAYARARQRVPDAVRRAALARLG
jgi:hypothetical protein